MVRNTWHFEIYFYPCCLHELSARIIYDRSITIISHYIDIRIDIIGVFTGTAAIDSSIDGQIEDIIS